MTGEQWREVEELFATLSALPEYERAARLSLITDDEVRRELDSFLDHAYAGETVQNAIAGVIPSPDDTLPIGPAGPQRFGPWRALRPLGKGGQGAVFEGIRDDGSFEQRVAIKIINWVVDNGPARARFRLERQILAALEHPGIARLLDAGASWKTALPIW